MRKIILTILCLLLTAAFAVSVSAEEGKAAADISGDTAITGSGYSYFGFLKDKDKYVFVESGPSASITLENAAGMGSLYLMFDYEYWNYTITDPAKGKSITAGKYGYLHEFIDLYTAFGYAPEKVVLDFTSGSVTLSEIYVFSAGEVPDFVQKWEPPLDEGADILMLPTHGDDDHLYFAGLLPYYAGELDYRVQVVYLTSHRWDNTVRAHEILNGLWATGVETYPVLGYGLDFRVDSLEGSYRVYANNGISKEELVGFVVEQLRRFKPLVAVGHDIDGEYGHGMHKVYADLLMQAVAVSNDPHAYPELTQKYGTWDVPKTYLHLLETDPIVIDYDIPLESFGGLTAFQVSQQYGFPCHVSQHIYKAFIEWLYGKENEITKASQIERHNPCEFGLYRSTVGPDVQKNDFLENVVTYDQQLLLEQERLAQEKLELERQEQARKEREQREQERLAQEEADRLTEEEEQMLQELLAAQDALRRRNLTIALVFGGVIAIAFTVAYDATKRRYEKDPALRNKNKKIQKRRK